MKKKLILPILTIGGLMLFAFKPVSESKSIIPLNNGNVKVDGNSVGVRELSKLNKLSRGENKGYISFHQYTSSFIMRSEFWVVEESQRTQINKEDWEFKKQLDSIIEKYK